MQKIKLIQLVAKKQRRYVWISPNDRRLNFSGYLKYTNKYSVY